MESLKAFWEQTQERERQAEEIADDIFPIDFHIYEVKLQENGWMQIRVETVWQVLDGSCSGDKKTRKQLRNCNRRNDAINRGNISNTKDDRISAENIRSRMKPTAAMGNHSIRGGLLFPSPHRITRLAVGEVYESGKRRTIMSSDYRQMSRYNTLSSPSLILADKVNG